VPDQVWHTTHFRELEVYEAEEVVIEAFMGLASKMGKELKCMSVLGPATMHADEG